MSLKALKAIELVGVSFERCKSFLLPFNFKTWLKLGLLILFAGTAFMSMPQMNYQFDSHDFSQWRGNYSAQPATSGNMTAPAGTSLSEKWNYVWGNYSTLIISAVTVLLILLLAFWFVSSLFIFTFINSVDERKVLIGRFTKANLPRGVSYFLFDLLVTMAFLASLAAAALAIYKAVLTGGMLMIASIVLLMLLLLVLILAAIMIEILMHTLMIYCMYLKKQKALESLASSWLLLKENLKETIIFILVRAGLSIAGAIATGIAWLIAAIVIAIPAVVIGAIGYLVYVTLGLALTIAYGILFGLVFLALLATMTLLVIVPASTFLATYNLLFVKSLLKIKDDFKMPKASKR
ncbi:hypothetical protein JW826_05955 [Candidatus Woesearchaeota archaeon]|nr:hypothetical protein [Candidatus Woesearchaeota archaeon]